MKIRSLQTVAFRNLQDTTLRPHPRFNVISGDNAQGKTNLLDALYLVCGLGSFRGARSAEMIRFGAEAARVRARVESLGLCRELEVTLGASGRQARLSGKLARSPAVYLEGLSAVVFTPEDLQVPRGAPGLRRRLLDRSVAGVWPTFLGLGRDYLRVLQSRNRLLKEGRGGDRALIGVYERKLVELGARLTAARVRYLGAVAPLYGVAYGEITRSGVQAELRYRSSARVEGAGAAIEALEGALSDELEQRRGEDLQRRVTTWGPHTDDLEFLLDGRSARTYGSQGQLRAAVLALRMAQITDSYRVLGFYPVLLLDDVSSELDRSRNEYLFEFIKERRCQTFLTTPRPELIEIREDRLDFQVVSGDVRPMATL